MAFFIARYDYLLYYHPIVEESQKAQIAANFIDVREKINRAAAKAGRSADEIVLVAVSKTYPAEAISAAVSAGATDIGESRVQEGTDKIERLGNIARWHLIGHLQTNKARRAVECFDIIQSVDSLKLAEKISQNAVELTKTIDCLIEVNSSGEDSKFGLPPDSILSEAEKILALPGINLKGLMTIGPWTTNSGCVKKAFDDTRQLFDKMQDNLGKGIEVLSMGMSSDFELAIQCGSNMVRVGTAIFGQR